jgi:hypothetical protein
MWLTRVFNLTTLSSFSPPSQFLPYFFHPRNMFGSVFSINGEREMSISQYEDEKPKGYHGNFKI